jgi:hypothetical protein
MAKYSIYHLEVEKEMQDIIERKVASNEYNFEGKRRHRTFREHIKKNEMMYSIVVGMGEDGVDYRVVYKEPIKDYYEKQENMIIRYKPVEIEDNYSPEEKKEIEEKIIKKINEEYASENGSFKKLGRFFDGIYYKEELIHFRAYKTLKNYIVINITGTIKDLNKYSKKPIFNKKREKFSEL